MTGVQTCALPISLFFCFPVTIRILLQQVNIKRKRGVNRHKIDKETCAGNKNAMHKTISISDGHEKTTAVGKSGEPIEARTSNGHHGRSQKRKIL